MPMVSEPISVIVPTLNEAGNIPRLMERLHQTFMKKRVPYEVIMVDDYSNAKLIQLFGFAAFRDRHVY